MITFLHCADLHIGRPFRLHNKMNRRTKEKIIDAPERSFSGLISLAISKNVQFILISGDVFHQKKPSIKSMWFFKQELERLSALSIPVYIILGNHDPSISYLSQISWPSNTQLFESNKVEVKELLTHNNVQVYFYGFSYLDSFPLQAPLQEFKEQKKDTVDAYHIGMLHGQENGTSGHEPYAPFRAIDLESLHFDYWALGHVHERKIISKDNRIIYPGNIQSGHRKEKGEKGGYIIELSKTECSPEFFSTSDVIWEQINISINNLSKLSEMIEGIEKQIESFLSDHFIMLDVYVKGEGPLHTELMKENIQLEILDTIQNLVKDENRWIADIYYQTNISIDRKELYSRDDLIGDIVRYHDTLIENLAETRESSLTDEHALIKKYSPEYSDTEEKDIIHQAEKLILSHLLAEEEEIN